MDGSIASGGTLLGRLSERHADLERLIATERARAIPDEGLIRRLSREKLLARDRMAALSGCGMPRWARGDDRSGE
ncbi:DUF465 domain-containing protein [Falsiroseomonas sp. CW058]|uniref:DUF465 domain-containing protein n=1 Tax=Falsiroseomonas sp. CW058 TaxID=3388664 RepID=UPI003D313D96